MDSSFDGLFSKHHAVVVLMVSSDHSARVDLGASFEQPVHGHVTHHVIGVGGIPGRSR